MENSAFRSVSVLAVCLALAACAGHPAPKFDGKPVAAVTGDGGVQRVTIVAGSYFFSPPAVLVKINRPVELTLSREEGLVPHDFTLAAPEAGIDIFVKLSTEPKVVRFTPTKTGTYTFFCGKKLLFFESHREKGMAGTLQVTE